MVGNDSAPTMSNYETESKIPIITAPKFTESPFARDRKRSLRTATYWQTKRMRRSNAKICQVVASAKLDGPIEGDGRPHLTVTIAGEQIRGLLDSGAGVSCLGKGAMERLTRLNLNWFRLGSFVQTADGAPQEIVGNVSVPIEFGNKTRTIRLFIVPSLKQELYLGIDFWRSFGIAPMMINELSATEANTVSPIDTEPKHVLTEIDQRRLDKVRAEFPSYTDRGLGRTSLVKHVIDVGDNKPIKQRHYPISPAVQKLVYEELDRMLALDVIEESHSSWNSPVVLVRKPNGKSRLCLDARKINSVTVTDAYPLPNIDGVLCRLTDTRYISSIDLKDAFWQVELDQASRDKTAFSVPGRPLYQFKAMPFGLCNASSTMCRLMDKAIPNQLHDRVFVYLDDLLVVSSTFEEHLELLSRVATHLRDAKLTINVEKSKFCRKELRYLGYVIGNGCIKTDPGKVAGISDFPRPTTKRQVRRFLGMAGWYRRFIENYASISTPLTDLTKKDGVFQWSKEAEKAFIALKRALTCAPLLAQPDFSRKFYVQCDASSTGIGSVLFQTSDDGAEHPVAFMSHKLTSPQRNYSVTELECYAALESVRKFRPYIEGTAFTIITDHASLKWLMSQKDLSGRLARWSLKLQGYTFDIVHRKGTQNVVADTLSRTDVDELAKELSAIEHRPLNIDLESAEFNDPDYVAWREHVATNDERLPDISVRDGRIYKLCQIRDGDPTNEAQAWKLWVPKTMTSSLISGAHDPPSASHCGIVKTLERLRRKFYWPGMAKQVNEYIGSCEICKQTKAPNYVTRPPMGDQIEVERPWQRVYTDLLGPYPRSKMGNTFVLVVLDQFSRFVLMKPLRKATATEVVRFLEQQVFHVFGVPEKLHSDNGVQYRSHEFKKLMTDYAVKHTFTAIHAPQSNASERVNRSILAAVRAYIENDQREWDVHLSSVGSALRDAIHQSTKCSPHFLAFGTHRINHGSDYDLLRKLEAVGEDTIEVLGPADFQQIIRERVKENLRKAHSRNAATYNVRSREVSFTPGQEIYYRNFSQSDFSRGYNSKLAKKYLKGRIAKRVGNSLYEVENLSGRLIATFHAKDLKQ